MLATNADALQAELMKIDQQLIETQNDRITDFHVLSELTSTAIPPGSKLILPMFRSVPQHLKTTGRIAVIQHSAAKDRCDEKYGEYRWNPKFYAFGQAGYGRPVWICFQWFFSMVVIRSQADLEYLNWIRIKMKRNLWYPEWYYRYTKETFEKNLRIETESEIAEIEKLGELLQKDEDIVALRTKITHSASSQLDNGVITSSDILHVWMRKPRQSWCLRSTGFNLWKQR